MDSDFNEDDHKFVMQETHVRDSSHLEPDRKEKVIVYVQKKKQNIDHVKMELGIDIPTTESVCMLFCNCN